MTKRNKLSVILGLISVTLLSQTSCSTFATRNSRAILNRDADVIISDDYKSSRRVDTHSSPREIASEPLSKPILNTNSADFDWPVDKARFIRGFMPEKRRPHLGVDLASPRGTPILSAQAGTVIYRGNAFRGFGKMILIESGYGWATLYAHLDKFYVEQGQKVGQGDMIGAMGRSGRATGVHLHFEIRKGRGPVDPLQYLPGGTKVSQL